MPRISWLGTVALLLLMGCSPATTVAEAPVTPTVASTQVAPEPTADEDQANEAETPVETTESEAERSSEKASSAAKDDPDADAPEASVAAAAASAAEEAEQSAAAHPEWGPLYDVLSIYDGDTIAVSIDGARERVRIIGIDAPEMGRSGNAADCYAQPATSRVQSLLQGERVHLLADPTQADRDAYDRLLRHVVLNGGGHLALLLVEEGFAVERQYAAPYQYQSDLQAAQGRARAAGLGLWSECTVAAAPATPAPAAPAPAAPAPAAPAPPAQPAPAPPAPPPAPPAVDPAACNIKGNISSSGERIYHVPGQRHYEETVISPEKGERWFCTEQEAVAAGWRKAKV